MSVSLTDAASRHVLAYASKHHVDFCGIRFVVRSSGCSGWKYSLEYADSEQEGDLVFESKGVKIFVDPKSYVHICGTVLDYTKEGLQEGFRFNNPNAKNVCGCGESFGTAEV